VILLSVNPAEILRGDKKPSKNSDLFHNVADPVNFMAFSHQESFNLFFELWIINLPLFRIINGPSGILLLFVPPNFLNLYFL